MSPSKIDNNKLHFLDTDGLAQLTSNEYLVLAGTLHGIHAITSRLSPIPGQSSGAQVIEGETFKISVLLTLTGTYPHLYSFAFFHRSRAVGTKFILLTSPAEPASSIDVLLQKIYTTYAEKVMQNPFHTPEMPIRSEAFDVSLGALIS